MVNCQLSDGSGMCTDQPKKARRRWWQFSLRTFLIVVLLVGMGFGWLGMQLKRVHEQRRIVALIQQAGGCVVYDYQQLTKPSQQRTPPGPQVLRSLCGDDLFASVEGVSFLLLEGTPTDSDVGQIVDLPGLRDLGLRGSKISDQSLTSVTQIRRLRDLWLRDTSVTPLGLRQLAVSASLEKLRLEGPSISDAHLKSLDSLQALRLLYLSQTAVTDAGMCEIGKLTGLTYLQLSRCAAVTSEGLEPLRSLKNLESLRIDGTAITKEGLRILPELPKLRTLALYGLAIDNEALAHLGQIASLQDLELPGKGVTAAGLAELAKLKDFRALSLPDVPMGEAELSCWGNLKELRALNITGTPMGEVEFRRLRPSTKLEYLHVTLGKSVPAEAIQELRKALPKCRVTLWDVHGLIVKE